MYPLDMNTVKNLPVGINSLDDKNHCCNNLEQNSVDYNDKLYNKNIISSSNVHTLSNLPPEIRERIARYCSQSDAFRLSLLCRSLAESSIMRLYEHIIIDSRERYMDEYSTTTIAIENEHEHENESENENDQICNCRENYLNTTNMKSNEKTKNSPIKDKIEIIDDTKNIKSNIFDKVSTEKNKSNTNLVKKKSSVSCCKNSSSNLSTMFGKNSTLSHYTVVRTASGLRKCLKSIEQSTKSHSKNYARWIKVFECYKIPDIPIPQFRKYMEKIIPYMSNLNMLVWKCTPQVPISMLKSEALFHAHNSLTTLSLEMPMYALQRCLGDLENFIAFPQLTHFDLRPFRTPEFLAPVAKMLTRCPVLERCYLGRDMVVSRGLGFSDMIPSPHNRRLRISFEEFNNITTEEDSINNALLFSSIDIDEDLEDFALRKFCKSYGTYKEHERKFLFKFGFEGSSVSFNDAFLLSSSIDLKLLTHLSLVNIYEHFSNTGPDSIQGDNEKRIEYRFKSSFLGALINATPNVRVLHLDWYQEGDIDTIPEYILSAFPLGLVSLNLKIRWHKGRIASANSDGSWESICKSYVDAIVESHSKTLCKLAIETAEENYFIATDTVKIIKGEILMGLKGCVNLTGLRVACKSMLSCESSLVSYLPNLEFLDLYAAGGPAFLGQGFLLGDIRQDWMRFEHIVSDLVYKQPCLKFIKMESLYLFDVRLGGSGLVMGGADRWFEEQVVENWDSPLV